MRRTMMPSGTKMLLLYVAAFSCLDTTTMRVIAKLYHCVTEKPAPEHEAQLRDLISRDYPSPRYADRQVVVDQVAIEGLYHRFGVYGHLVQEFARTANEAPAEEPARNVRRLRLIDEA